MAMQTHNNHNPENHRNGPYGPVIFVVENNDDDASLILQVVGAQRPDATVHVARDGNEALDYLNAWTDTPPNLILLNLNLPSVSGLSVLEQVRTLPLTRRVPVVVISDKQTNNEVEKSYDLGANSFLNKGTQREQFEDIISKTLPYWLQLNHPYTQQGGRRR